MDTRIIFLFFAVISLLLGAEIGDSVNQLHAEHPKGSNHSGWKMWSVITVFLTIVGYVLYFVGEMDRWHDPVEHFFYQLGPILTAFGGSATYAIFAGPFWQSSMSEFSWFSGWLIFVIIGILPAVLTINQLFIDAAEAEAGRPK